MSTPRTASADSLMIEVLAHLAKVSDFLRYRGRHDAANSIGKFSVDIANAYSLATEEPVPPKPRAVVASQPSMEYFGCGALLPSSERLPPGIELPMFSPIHPPQRLGIDLVAESTGLVKPRDTAKMLLLDLEDLKTSHEIQNKDILRARTEHLANGNIDCNAPNGTLCRLPCIGFPGVNAVSAPVLHDDMVQSKSAGSIQMQRIGLLEEEIAGAVVIRGSFQGRNMASLVSFIADHIREGPLFEIKVNSNHKCTVIFQYVAHARHFINRNKDSVATGGLSCLGDGYRIFFGGPRDWTDDIKKMSYPGRERRRLTFAKSRLFGDQLSPQQWERDVMSIAGGPNVNVLWIFNAGNATAVFRSTLIARKVLSVFTNWKATRPQYHGLEVSYSADPCEKELVLSTQMKSRQHKGSMSRTGRR